MKTVKREICKKIGIISQTLALLALTAFCLWYHDYCMGNFPYCPEEECPYRYFFQDINMWRADEKLIMSDIQTGLRDIWFIGMDLLTPDHTTTTSGDILGATKHQYQKLHKIWRRFTTWFDCYKKPSLNNIELSDNNNNASNNTAATIIEIPADQASLSDLWWDDFGFSQSHKKK